MADSRPHAPVAACIGRLDILRRGGVLAGAGRVNRFGPNTMSSNILFVGVKSHVVAIDKNTGADLWRTKLKGGLTSSDTFVSILVQGGRIYAHTNGEVFCLDQPTGAILWSNGLSGLGYDMASLAAEGIASPPPEMLAMLQKQRSAAGTGSVVPGSGI